MNGNSTDVFLFYWEIHKTTGSWVKDGSSACTLNASGTYTPTGQAVTLGNTTTPHIIFQSITAQGGLGGATLYPVPFSPTDGYVGQLGDNTSAEVALLNTVNGTAPTWSTPQENAITTGVCAEAFY